MELPKYLTDEELKLRKKEWMLLGISMLDTDEVTAHFGYRELQLRGEMIAPTGYFCRPADGLWIQVTMKEAPNTLAAERLADEFKVPA